MFYDSTQEDTKDLIRDRRFKEAIESIMSPNGVPLRRSNLYGVTVVEHRSRKLDSSTYQDRPQQVADEGDIRGGKELLIYQ